MVEQAHYPYNSGLYGIPFVDIEMDRHNSIRGGSGRKLSVLITKTGIDIVDEQDDWFNLGAWVTNRILHMQLYTRKSSMQETHPDFFAGKFVDFAVKHFKRNGVYIRFFEAIWFKDSENESTNYDQFMLHLNLIGDEKEAARRTWTGNLIKSYGFNDVRSIHRKTGIEEDGENITVLFAKSNT